MIEEHLRESFARHEAQAPETDTLRQGIRRLAARRRRRRLAVGAGSVAVLVVAVLVAVPLALRQTVAAGLGGALPGSTNSSGVPDRALNILLVGLDPPDFGVATDNITVVHITADRKRVYLADIERDVAVDLPGVGQTKINSVYQRGGLPLLSSAVQKMTGLTLDGSVALSLGALSEITDDLGGLKVCLPANITSWGTKRTFSAGCSTMDGSTVADLAQQRHDVPMGAYGRSANIHRILISLVTRVSSLNLFTDAGRLNALAHTDGLTIDVPGINLIELATQVRGLTGESVVGIVSPRYQHAPGDGNQNYEALDPVVAPQLFAAFRDGTLDQFAAAHPDWLVKG